MAKRYVILDSSPGSFGNDDFFILGLKAMGYARGCPMLFGGTSDPKDGSPDSKLFSLNVLKREVNEETVEHVKLNSAERFQVYPSDLIVFSSSDFEFEGGLRSKENLHGLERYAAACGAAVLAGARLYRCGPR